jgi:hypothetical protein
MNGLEYLNFSQNDLPGLLEDVPLDARQNMWLLHDGAPSHNRRVVRDYLDISFANKFLKTEAFSITLYGALK